ncbi:MAG: flagellar hook-basal body complex protein, partial [Planctomycetota bacterium]
MIYGLYQSAAGMMVNEYRQGVLANNLANAETTGFKRDIAAFSERRTASQAGERRGPTHDLMERLTGGIWLGKTTTDFGEGALQRTGMATDVALAGPGFFQVRDASGADLLTRDGRLLIDGDGWLVSATDGAQVLGRGGAPIRLNPRGGEPTIDD